MSKIIDENPDFQEIVQKIVDHLGTKENQASMYATLIVCSHELSKFVMKSHHVNSMPLEILYYMSLSFNYYACIFKPEAVLGTIQDPDFQDYFESGDLDDKFAMVVKQLYQICKKKKLL